MKIKSLGPQTCGTFCHPHGVRAFQAGCPATSFACPVFGIIQSKKTGVNPKSLVEIYYE